jgi:hypothetical protein
MLISYTWNLHPLMISLINKSYKEDQLFTSKIFSQVVNHPLRNALQMQQARNTFLQQATSHHNQVRLYLYSQEEQSTEIRKLGCKKVK